MPGVLPPASTIDSPASSATGNHLIFDADDEWDQGIDETQQIKILYLFHLIMRGIQQCAGASLPI